VEALEQTWDRSRQLGARRAEEKSMEEVVYLLYQEHCDCPMTVATCCLGSRHPRKAKLNCRPTKGEALTMAWAVEDTRSLTLGRRDPHVEERCQKRDRTARNYMKTTRCRVT
jgi:hypothetical protein